MILDRMEHRADYFVLHSGFSLAFEFLQGLLERPFAPGTEVLSPGRLWVVMEEGTGRGRTGAPLETHRRMIDIQLVLSGEECIGWLPLADCRDRERDYDAARDIEFFRDQPAMWFNLQPGMFCIFFPHDAHAPLAGTAPVRKAIAKVAVNW